MKIAYKLPLAQLFLTLLFLLSLSFISFFFIRTSELMIISSRLDQFYEEIQMLRSDLRLLPQRQEDFTNVYNDFVIKQRRLQEQNEELQESLSFYLTLYPEMDKQFGNLTDQWNSIYANYFDPLKVIIRSFANSPAATISSGNNLYDSLNMLEGTEYEDSNALINEIISKNISFIYILDTEFLKPLEQFRSLTEERMLQLQKRMGQISLLISFLTFLTGIFIGLVLSGRISRNLVLLDKSIGQVASGDLHFNLTTIGKDEFQDIGDYFNKLTDTLWFRLDSLKDIMRDLGSSLEDDTEQATLLETILELAIDSTSAESGVITLFNEERQDLEVAAMMGNFPPPVKIPGSVMMNENYVKEWFKRYHIKMNETLIGEAAQRKSYFFIKDNEAQSLFPNNSNPNSSLFISSAIILPLMNEDNLLGVLILSKNTKNDFFTELDNTFMKSFSRFVTITLDNFRKYQEVVHKHELNREIGVAAEIQKTLLPGRLPRMKNLQIGAYSDAAKGVSGDYYDVFPLDKNKIAIIICDVSGKGIPASLFMVMIRTVIRTISSPSMNAAEILKSVNQEITGNFRTGTFATISLLIVDQKRYEISYANGAHHPLYLYRAKTGKYLKFDADGLPLGIDIHATFGHKRIRIEPEDYLLLFTDGLTEARNETGEELSTNRLLKQALLYTKKGAPQMKDSIRGYLKKFCGTAKQHDDETFVAIKIT